MRHSCSACALEPGNHIYQSPHVLEHLLCNKGNHCSEKRSWRVTPTLQQEKSLYSIEDSAQLEKKKIINKQTQFVTEGFQVSQSSQTSNAGCKASYVVQKTRGFGAFVGPTVSVGRRPDAKCMCVRDREMCKAREE